MRPLRSVVTAVPLAIIALVALSGCVPSEDAPKPSSSATATSTPTPTATPTQTAPPTPVDGADTPLTIGCDALVTSQNIYDFNPNYALKSDYSPAAGSPAAEAVAFGGIACAWVNLTSGDVIEIAAAQPSPEKLTALANDLVMSSNSVPTFGVEGYFLAANGAGAADAFSGPYWITASAATFLEPGDAEPLMLAAIGNLG